MTEISVAGDDALAGVIMAQKVPLDMYLTLRNGDGAVLWSGSVYQMRHDFDFDKVHIRTEPVAKAIERSVEWYRAAQQVKYTQAGLL